jgi:GLPGLI family protein
LYRIIIYKSKPYQGNLVRLKITIMKNILFIKAFFLFAISISGQNFSGEVIYSTKLNFTEENLREMESKNDKATNSMRKVLANSTDTEVLLKFNTTQSYYKVVKKLEIAERKPLNMTYSIAGGEKVYFTDLIANKSIMQECKLLEACFLVEQEPLKWELSQETKIVGGYLCYKAINSNSNNKKKKPIAWYAPQISVGFGPKDYYGLPGLILELEESAVIFSAKKIILNPKEELVIVDMKGEKISKEDYQKKLKKSYGEFH